MYVLQACIGIDYTENKMDHLTLCLFLNHIWDHIKISKNMLQESVTTLCIFFKPDLGAQNEALSTGSDYGSPGKLIVKS